MRFQPLLILLEDPGAEDSISDMIAVVELEESKRKKVIEEMSEDYNVTLLDPVDYIEKNDLYIRFVKVTK